MIKDYIKYYYLMLICICLLFPKSIIYAAGTSGTSGADFLEIGVGSRPLGMGEAFTAAQNDLNCLYYNPAGLGTMKYSMFSFMHQELILDSRFENFSISFPVFRGFMVFSNSVFWVPTFEKIDIDGNETGTVQFYNSATTLGIGFSLGFMEIGASTKYIYQRIDTLKLHALAFDFGVLKRLYMFSPFKTPTRNFSLGLSIQNIGTKVTTFNNLYHFWNLGDDEVDDPLPRTIRLGTSYYLTKWFGLNIDFIENLIDTSDLYDFTYGFDESFRIYSGVEFNYFEILSLRAGYKFNDGGTYSLGMGFNYVVSNTSLMIDTSYTDSGIFGPVYSFAVTMKLIPHVITVEDKINAEKHYRKGIRLYIQNDIDSAIDEFIKCRNYNEYHKNVKQKIEELQELKRLREENESLQEEDKRFY